ncbi:MAG: rhomboid family intramembrane serine protease [Terriglobia bacterium]
MFPLRDENPTEIFPFVTIGLIALNVLIFIYQWSLGPAGLDEQFILTYSLIPYEVVNGVNIQPVGESNVYSTLLTSMFLHGGIVHILGNMWYLWIFGNNVEDSLGHGRFLLFYLLAGLGGSLLHVVSGPNSQVPSLGASGAISGVLGAYLILYPRARIITLIVVIIFIQVIKLPALLLIGFWLFFQLLSGAASVTAAAAGGVAWFAHIGGFLAGFALILLIPKRRSRLTPVRE